MSSIAASTYDTAKNVTVSDTVPDPNTGVFGYFAGLYVGASGNVKVTTASGDQVVFIGVVAGTIIPVHVNQVWSTGTTVASPNTNILGLIAKP